jgi:hypothetical protein
MLKELKEFYFMTDEINTISWSSSIQQWQNICMIKTDERIVLDYFVMIIKTSTSSQEYESKIVS